MTSLFGRLSNFYFWYFAFVGAFAPFFSLYLQRRGFSPIEIAVLLGISPTLRIVVPFFWDAMVGFSNGAPMQGHRQRGSMGSSSTGETGGERHPQR